MPLTSTSQALAAILQPKLEAMAAPGGSSTDCAKLAQAIATSITEWLIANGTDAVTVVSSMVATTGSATAQAGTVTQFVGKIV